MSCGFDDHKKEYHVTHAMPMVTVITRRIIEMSIGFECEVTFSYLLVLFFLLLLYILNISFLSFCFLCSSQNLSTCAQSFNKNSNQHTFHSVLNRDHLIISHILFVPHNVSGPNPGPFTIGVLDIQCQTAIWFGKCVTYDIEDDGREF